MSDVQQQIKNLSVKIDGNAEQSEITKVIQNNAISDLSEIIEYTNERTLKIMKEYNKAAPNILSIERNEMEIEVHMNEHLPHKKGRIVVIPNPSLKEVIILPHI